MHLCECAGAQERPHVLKEDVGAEPGTQEKLRVEAQEVTVLTVVAPGVAVLISGVLVVGILALSRGSARLPQQDLSILPPREHASARAATTAAPRVVEVTFQWGQHVPAGPEVAYLHHGPGWNIKDTVVGGCAHPNGAAACRSGWRPHAPREAVGLSR